MYRVVVVSPDLLINQCFKNYDDARLLADAALEMVGASRPLTVEVRGPHARDPSQGEVRLWSYEVTKS